MTVLRLELRASRALAGAVVLVHGAGAVAALLAAPGTPGLGLAALLLALGAATVWRAALLRAPGSVRALELAEDGAVRLELGSGARTTGRIADRRHVSPWWVVLPVQASRRVILVTRDMVTPGDFRRLRLWALWGRVPAAAQPARAG
jgi:toxin CptA